MSRLGKSRRLVSLVAGGSAGAHLVRRLAPATIGLPVLVGLLRLAGERGGLFGVTFGVALMIIFSVVGATALLLWTAGSLDRVDADRRRVEEALRRSSEQHRTLARSFPDGAIVLFDRDLRHLVADGMGLAGVGLSSALMEGRTIWEVFPPEVCAVIEPRYRAALAGEQSTFEYSWARRTYLVRVVPVADEQSGEVWGGAVMVHEISSRKRAEQALRESEARLAEAQTLAQLGSWEWRIAENNVIWSDELYRIYGLEPGLLELSYEALLERVHPDDRKHVKEQVRRAQERGEPFTFEHRILRPDGSERWVQARGELIRAEGVSTVMRGTAQDITERRADERRLREAEERYRTLVEQLPLVTYVRPLDMRDSNIYASPQVERMLGYAAELWQSDPGLLEKIVHPDDLERVLTAAKEVRTSGIPFRGEYRYVRPDGEIVWVQDETYLIRDASGQPTRVEGYLLDITEQKSAEEERDRLEADLLHAQKLEAIGQLAGGVAHEFNNMLMAINGHSALLLEKLAPESPLRRDVEQITGSSERAAALTRQLLAFGRKQVLRKRSIDLNEVVAASVRLLRPLIDARIELVTEVDTKLPAAVADPAQVEQVLVNLVLNARDAIAGPGTITISTTATELDELAASAESVEPGRYLRIAVADTGAGIDEQTCSRIFEPFFTTKEVGQGTGLGLSTVYGIVRQGGGFLAVESEPGRGTTMTIALPASAESIAPAEAAERTHTEPAPRGRALVVDDETVVRNVCAELLEQFGFAVLSAGDGEHALQLLEQQQAPIDLLLTDMVMPGIGGRELARRATLIHPETTIVYMSGYPGDQAANAGDKTGAGLFLQKPFTAAELELAIAAVAPVPDEDPSAATRLTCVVADDHPSVRDAVCRVLGEAHVRVVAQATDAREAIEHVKKHIPDVALIDIHMPGPGAIEVAKQLRETSPATRLLLYTGHTERELVADALAAGAQGVVLKSAPLAELAKAIKIVADGGIYVDQSFTGVALPSVPARDPRPNLTAREHEVLRLLADGNTNDQVAKTLTISADTVQTHVRNAMKKLGADTRTQAVASAMRQALIH